MSDQALANLIAKGVVSDGKADVATERAWVDPWQWDAECRDLPVELFYADTHDTSGYPLVKKFCGRCSVRGQCLETALAAEALPEAYGLRYGLWGGLTPVERQKLVDERKASNGNG